MNFAEFIKANAEQCEWKIQEDSEFSLHLNFETEMGEQTIYIDAGKHNNGSLVASFSSSPHPVPEDSEVAGIFAITLLRRNSKLMYGHWGIQEYQGEQFFSLSTSHPVEKMGVDDFRESIVTIIEEEMKFFQFVNSLEE